MYQYHQLDTAVLQHSCLKRVGGDIYTCIFLGSKAKENEETQIEQSVDGDNQIRFQDSVPGRTWEN